MAVLRLLILLMAALVAQGSSVFKVASMSGDLLTGSPAKMSRAIVAMGKLESSRGGPKKIEKQSKWAHRDSMISIHIVSGYGSDSAKVEMKRKLILKHWAALTAEARNMLLLLALRNQPFDRESFLWEVIHKGAADAALDLSARRQAADLLFRASYSGTLTHLERHPRTWPGWVHTREKLWSHDTKTVAAAISALTENRERGPYRADTSPLSQILGYASGAYWYQLARISRKLPDAALKALMGAYEKAWSKRPGRWALLWAEVIRRAKLASLHKVAVAHYLDCNNHDPAVLELVALNASMRLAHRRKAASLRVKINKGQFVGALASLVGKGILPVLTELHHVLIRGSLASQATAGLRTLLLAPTCTDFSQGVTTIKDKYGRVFTKLGPDLRRAASIIELLNNADKEVLKGVGKRALDAVDTAYFEASVAQDNFADLVRRGVKGKYVTPAALAKAQQEYKDKRKYLRKILSSTWATLESTPSNKAIEALAKRIHTTNAKVKNQALRLKLITCRRRARSFVTHVLDVLLSKLAETPKKRRNR